MRELKVSLLDSTGNPEKVIAVAAKTCYNSGTTENLWETIKNEDVFIEKLKQMHHMSPFEHTTFTFGIDGVSRALLAQLTRHRIASFSVQSQRYVPFDTSDEQLNTRYICPSLIRESEQETFDLFCYALKSSDEYYNKLVEGLKKGGHSEKEAIEEARYILPSAAKTNLVMTMNARELMHFFELRCCKRAQKEIRDLAWTILDILKEKHPQIFSNCGPKCLTTGCIEGEMSCGHPYRRN